MRIKGGEAVVKTLVSCDVATVYGARAAPLVFPSAMACRRIVIATQTAATGYLPPNLVVQNGDSDEIARKISFYLSNTKDRRLIEKELYRKAVNELS